MTNVFIVSRDLNLLPRRETVASMTIRARLLSTLLFCVRSIQCMYTTQPFIIAKPIRSDIRASLLCQTSISIGVKLSTIRVQCFYINNANALSDSCERNCILFHLALSRLTLYGNDFCDT